MPGDSGWYVGAAEDVASDAYHAARVAELVENRPELRAALGLPVGYLVVLNDAELEALVDARGRLLWPGKA